MANSKAQIFNIALNILGVSSPIENADFEDNRAILLNNYYDLARDYVLKDFDWNFANNYRELSLVKNPPVFNKFRYCYDYPNDCICARDLFEKNSSKQEKFSIISLSEGQKAVITDCSSPVLRYTKRIEQEVFFSCEFSMALAHYLASLVANVITGSIQKGEIAYEKYRKILSRAKVLNAIEGGEYIYDETTYIDSRG